MSSSLRWACCGLTVLGLGTGFVGAFQPPGTQLSPSLRGRSAEGTSSASSSSSIVVSLSAVLLACAAGQQNRLRGAERASGRTRCQAARLHGNSQTRSPLVNWYCNEANIPIEMREARPSPHPFGQVPHLSDDGGVEVFESGAILLYLADKYGGLSTAEERAKYSKWVVWANATLDAICFGHGMSGTQIASQNKTMDRLEDILSKSEWLVDNKFSVADVAVASYLNYVPVFFGRVDLSRRPHVAAYMKKCASRPGFIQAFGKRHADSVLSSVVS